MFHKTSLLTVLFLLCIAITVFGAWPKAENITTPPGATLGWDNANGYWRPLGSSFSDGALSTLDYEHHKIHEGRHFLYQESFTLASAGVATYVIQAPASPDPYSHLIFVLDGNAITQFELFEDTQYEAATTTPRVVINNNRNSPITNTMLVYKGATASGSIGLKLKEYKGS
jgi:hypothetical protein